MLAGTYEEYSWLPIDDFPQIISSSILGWTIYSFLPPGWIFWSGFCATIYMGRRLPFLLAVFAGIFYGVFWPKHFVAMMGV